MKMNIRYIMASAMLMAAASMQAQSTNSAYFTEGYVYRHEVNPAFHSDKGYVSMPFLGNISLGLQGNLNLQNFLYNVNGRTTTFMNPAISAQEVLKNISDNNKLSFDFKYQILAVGFKAFGGYNTIGINTRTNVGVNVPGSLFRLAKEGIENKTYDLSGLDVRANAFAEIALGHSREVFKGLNVGAKVKFLVGGGNVQAKLTNAQLSLNEDGYWDVTADAEVQASMKGLTYKSELAERDNNSRNHVTSAEVNSPGTSGYGVAFDLGAEYQIMDGLTVSASVTDLGYIKWQNNMLAQTYANNHVQTDQYIFSLDDDKANNFEDEMTKLTDDLAALADLEDKGDQGSRTTGLGATVRLGAEYKLPVYKKLSFGLLYSTRIQDIYTWHEARISANIAPAKCISAGVNFGAGTYGTSLGWILSLHPKGFSLFATMDHTLGKLTKQYIPLKSNADFSMGINFPF